MTILATVEQTRDFGRSLAAVLRAGDLVVLTGPLGAGKTALAQGVGAGLRVRGDITSPTFVIPMHNTTHVEVPSSTRTSPRRSSSRTPARASASSVSRRATGQPPAHSRVDTNAITEPS